MIGPKRNKRTVHLFGAAILIVATILAGLPLPATANGLAAPVDAHLWSAASAGGKVRAIVQGDNGAALSAAASRIGGRVVRELGLTPGLAVELPASSVSALARQPGVKRVLFDPPMVGHARDDSTIDPRKLAVAYPSVLKAAPLWQSGITGQDIGVALIDSGVSPSPDLLGNRGSRVIASARFGGASSPLNDKIGHGTAMAGVIAGNGAQSGGKYVGIAPRANIVDLKVGDDRDGAYASDVIGAIWWAVKHKRDYNIRVINISLTSSVNESYKTSLLDMAVEYAWFNGIVVVVSVGNTGANSALHPPANDPYVITVGATDDLGTVDTDDDVLLSYSAYGSTVDNIAKPELVAPGRHIVSILSNPNSVLATALPGRVVDRHYIRLSGTSLSAAEVSGLVAQVLQVHPQYRPDQLKWLLVNSAQTIRGVTTGAGAGYPNSQAAVEFGGQLGRANRGLVPNTYIAKAVAKLVFDGVSWDGVSWDGVSWDGVSWDGVSWDGVSWDGVSWDGVSWDGVSWDGVSWDGVSWDGVSWDGVSWDAVGLQ